MKTVLENIARVKLVPVVKIPDIESTIPIVGALYEGGLDVIEITFRSSCARDAIRLAVQTFPKLIIGAGTVTKIEQAVEAVNAGARFIVSPGLDDQIAKFCFDNNLLYLGGAVTPTEIMRAINLGMEVVKFFPAEPFGGLRMIKALSAPFPNVKFMPTGGIDKFNIKEYLNNKAVVACGGSWMVNDAILSAKDYQKITDLTKEALKEINL